MFLTVSPGLSCSTSSLSDPRPSVLHLGPLRCQGTEIPTHTTIEKESKHWPGNTTPSPICLSLLLIFSSASDIWRSWSREEPGDSEGRTEAPPDPMRVLYHKWHHRFVPPIPSESLQATPTGEGVASWAFLAKITPFDQRPVSRTRDSWLAAITHSSWSGPGLLSKGH
jgi:hypothetical protein